MNEDYRKFMFWVGENAYFKKISYFEYLKSFFTKDIVFHKDSLDINKQRSNNLLFK